MGYVFGGVWGRLYMGVCGRCVKRSTRKGDVVS